MRMFLSAATLRLRCCCIHKYRNRLSVTVIFIIPLFAPKQVTSVEATTALRTAGSVIVTPGFSTISHAGLTASLILTS